MIPRDSSLAEVKRRLSPHLLDLEGVTGVGLPGGQLTVYLVADSEEVRRRVREVIGLFVPEVEPRFEVTGPLRSQ